MLIIVEDGDMPAGANSYASVSDCDAYQLARGSTSWPAAPESGVDPNLAKKEAALIKATDYLNGLSWRGKRVAGGRVMAWPRIGAFDADGYRVLENAVPPQVMYACCYLAGIVYPGKVNLQPMLERGGRVQSESVGTLSTSFFEDAANRDVYAAVADLLSGLAIGLDAYAGSGNAKSGMTVGRVVLG